MNAFRRLARSAYERRLQRELVAFDGRDWTASALIVAPHPDDETLGCGGVAAKKIAAGGRVHFVIVTDGAASHRSVAPGKLAARRQAEAIEAVSRLGGAAESVTFLAVPDGRAGLHVGRIVDRLARILDELAPESVFAPHAEEPPADHVAVNVAVRRALVRRAVPVTVYEYPVWYWYHWPWVAVGGDLPRMWRPALRQTLRTGFGSRTLRTLNTRAFVGDVLAQKWAALAAHASQMQRPERDKGWATLADIGRGDFLARLLGEHEMFTRYRLHA